MSCNHVGTDFQDSINNVQMDIDRAQWKSEQHAEKMFSGRNFIPPRIVVGDFIFIEFCSEENVCKGKMKNGWIICDFTALSTAFQPY